MSRLYNLCYRMFPGFVKFVDNQNTLNVAAEFRTPSKAARDILTANPEPGEDVDAFEAAGKEVAKALFLESKRNGFLARQQLVEAGFDFVHRKLDKFGKFHIFTQECIAPASIFLERFNDAVEVAYHPGDAQTFFLTHEGYCYSVIYISDEGGIQ